MSSKLVNVNVTNEWMLIVFNNARQSYKYFSLFNLFLITHIPIIIHPGTITKIKFAKVKL